MKAVFVVMSMILVTVAGYNIIPYPMGNQYANLNDNAQCACYIRRLGDFKIGGTNCPNVVYTAAATLIVRTCADGVPKNCPGTCDTLSKTQKVFFNFPAAYQGCVDTFGKVLKCGSSTCKGSAQLSFNYKCRENCDP